MLRRVPIDDTASQFSVTEDLIGYCDQPSVIGYRLSAISYRRAGLAAAAYRSAARRASVPRGYGSGGWGGSGRIAPREGELISR